MKFSSVLVELRTKKGVTQQELANVLFVSRTTVSKWEAGVSYPNIQTLKSIAEYFNVTIDELLN